MPGPGSAIVARYAPVAAHITRFYERLHGDDRRADYPTADIEAAWPAHNAIGDRSKEIRQNP